MHRFTQCTQCIQPMRQLWCSRLHQTLRKQEVLTYAVASHMAMPVTTRNRLAQAIFTMTDLPDELDAACVVCGMERPSVRWTVLLLSGSFQWTCSNHHPTQWTRSTRLRLGVELSSARRSMTASILAGFVGLF